MILVCESFEGQGLMWSYICCSSSDMAAFAMTYTCRNCIMRLSLILLKQQSSKFWFQWES